MQRLKIFYRDKLLGVLKECSLKSASALSTMLTDSDVVPFSTSINLKPMEDLFMLPEDNIVVVSDITGDLSGVMIASFKADSGMKIINTMLSRDPEMIADLGEEEMGVLREYMSMVGGSYLSEFGNAFGFRIMPEVPQFEGKFKDVSGVMIEQLRALNEKILFINSSMTVISLNADAIFYVLFDEMSFNMILNLISKGSDDPFEEVL